MSLVMGTAGHIDHGKTTLIKALTGIDCDRLKEEKKRGITIELGFAYLDLPDGTRLGIIDVPGHEKFIKNMVAGAFGIDFVLMTIAADEGVMPQTQEHLEICSLLGIKDGIVAVTKIDKVDEELLEIAIEEIKDFLKGTFLEHSPIIPVSSYTGEGLDELVKVISDKVKKIKEKRSSDIFRLPIDRVFTLHGHGTIVTGTLIGGEIKEGELIEVYPRDLTSKIRSIQVHGQQVNRVSSGKRTAINLSDIKPDQIERGDVLGRPGSLFPSNLWDIELTLLPSSPKPLKNRKEIHFHHGTKEVLGVVYLLEKEVLEPGDTTIARIQFGQPMVGVFGDRFVIRSFSPLRTIGGGRLLNPVAKKLKRFSKKISFLKDIKEGDPKKIILAQLELNGLDGISFERLKVMTNLSDAELRKNLDELKKENLILENNNTFYLESIFERLEKELLQYIKEFFESHPLEKGVSQSRIYSEWRKDLPEEIIQILLQRCYKNKKLILIKDKVTLPDREIKLTPEQLMIKEKIESLISKSPLVPITFTKLKEELKIDKEKALPIIKFLVQEKILVKVAEDIWFSSKHIKDIIDKVLNFFSTKQELSPQDFKKLTGLSRKYSIPLLEYLDKEKITIRVGNVRKLRKKS